MQSWRKKFSLNEQVGMARLKVRLKRIFENRNSPYSRTQLRKKNSIRVILHIHEDSVNDVQT